MFYLLILILFVGIIATFIWRKNLREKWPKIVGVMFASPFIFVAGLVTFVLIGIVFLFLVFIFDDYKDYKIRETETIVSCGFDSSIKSARFGIGGGDQTRNYLIYYEKNDKRVFLNAFTEFGLTGIDSTILDRNPDFFKNETDTQNLLKVGGFSVLDFMQKDSFDIIDNEAYKKAVESHDFRIKAMKQTNKKYNANIYPRAEKEMYDTVFDYSPYLDGGVTVSQNTKPGIEPIKLDSLTTATYLDPRKVDQNLYKEIVECNKKGKEYHPDKGGLPTVLIYKDMQQKDNQKLTDWQGYSTNLFDSFSCQNPNYKLFLAVNGKVFIRNMESEYYSTDDKNLNLGFFDKDGNFVRDVEADKRFSVVDKDKDWHILRDVIKDANFQIAREKSELLRLTFNQNQEPINDYLQTCKNEEGKTIFNIFKD